MNNSEEKKIEYTHKITVERFFFPKSDTILAIANVNINGIVRINGLRILKTIDKTNKKDFYNNVDDGFSPLCVLMPQQKSTNGKYYGIVQGIDDTFNLELESQVLNQYLAEIAKPNIKR